MKEPVTKPQFRPKSALLPPDSVPEQTAYDQSNMSVCSEREPSGVPEDRFDLGGGAPKSSNLCKKASFATGSKKNIILGIDPGTRITGYGVIDADSNPLDFGCIKPPPKLTLPERYKILFDSVEALIEKYEPSAIAVESQFVLKNAQSAIKLGMAKGMIYLAAARRSIPLYEFAPKQAKLAVVGHGSASKFQVQKMIQTLLRLPQIPEPEDAADALALAICCSHHMRSPCTSRSKVF